ncbi:hypothetical protein [Granulicoccus phenolivorans]|uniref:hypothetical protein n=1 Tax=Granulicoccus phenolivorans TaxID=266854 RepID=UPI000767AC50|nr:hypothetical protein [Granulicoccus phenolivorans]
MAVVLVSYVPSRTVYDSVPVSLDPRPAGLIVHAAGEMPDGRIQIVDVWESSEDARSFEAGPLQAGFAEVGMAHLITDADRPQFIETFDLVR